MIFKKKRKFYLADDRPNIAIGYLAYKLLKEPYLIAGPVP